MSQTPPHDPNMVTRAELAAHLASGDPLNLITRNDRGRTIAGPLLREILIETDLARGPLGLTLIGARVSGDLDLSFCMIPSSLRLHSADIEGVLSLQGATITGQLVLAETRLNGRDDTGAALIGDGLKVSGGAFLDGVQVSKGAVRLTEATITGQLSLTGAELNGKDDTGAALVGDGLQINGNAALDLKVARGAVRLAGANITGQLNLTRVVLDGRDNNNGAALVADGLQVRGGARLGRIQVSRGSVRLAGANITGQLDLSGAELKGKDDTGAALYGDGLKVAGGAILGGVQVSNGGVRLVEAVITNQLLMTGAVLSGMSNDGSALDADGLHVNGGVYLNGIKVTQGAVRLNGATITGQLSLTGAELNGKDNQGCALAGERLHVQGDALLNKMEVAGSGKLSLRDGQLGSLVLDEYLPRSGWHRHNFLGLRYDQIYGGPARSAKQGARLLASQAEGPRAAQPYWHLADYHARVGNDSASRRLRVRSNALQARAHPGSWPRLFIYGLTTGFGYYPFLAILWLALLITLDTAAVGAHRGDFIPTNSPTIAVSAAKNQKAVNTAHCDTRYPCFIPVLYATDTVVPVISLGQQDAWRIDTSRAGTSIQVILLSTKAAGWVLTTLLIGGIGGLLRRN